MAAPVTGGAQATVVDVSATALPHGNHDPRYGGMVLMNVDVHFEVVLGRDGRYQVYFSDAAREELPASVASGVTITVTRTSRPPETVRLEIDETGESWTGLGRTIDDPAAVARISYSMRGVPYWIDLPVSSSRPAASRE